MFEDTELIKRVRQLIEAENESNKVKAAALLADNFSLITRARGEEQEKNALLEEIAQPRNPNLRRQLDEDGLWVMASGDLGVVRSVVIVTDKTDSAAAPKKFRNAHVFEKQQKEWHCVAWQVTELH
jgi:ketosteroid isomerase-like protein